MYLTWGRLKDMFHDIPDDWEIKVGRDDYDEKLEWADAGTGQKGKKEFAYLSVVKKGSGSY